MQKVNTCLWFDNNAEEAMNHYLSVFRNTKTGSISRYGKGAPMPEGTVLTATFALEGTEFMALNGGPAFRTNPSVSFFVNCDTENEVDSLYGQLSEGGSVLMPLQAYPFSPKYAWVEDKFGVSWQLSLGSRPQKIVPFLMFSGQQHGNAEEAMKLYASLFENSAIEAVNRYEKGEDGAEGPVKHGVFRLLGQTFMAVDSHYPHKFAFNEGVSVVAHCDSQQEIDHLWDRLSEGGEIQMCGWLKDRFGVSWQIVPAHLGKWIGNGSPEKAQRVVQALRTMIKLDMEALQKAYEG